MAIDTDTLQVRWKFATRGGAGNCNNVAAPAVVGNFVHVGTMAGYYYVLDRDSGDGGPRDRLRRADFFGARRG